MCYLILNGGKCKLRTNGQEPFYTSLWGSGKELRCGLTQGRLEDGAQCGAWRAACGRHGQAREQGPVSPEWGCGLQEDSGVSFWSSFCTYVVLLCWAGAGAGAGIDKQNRRGHCPVASSVCLWRQTVNRHKNR